MTLRTRALFVILGLAVPGLIFAGWGSTTGNGVAKTEKRNVAPFKAVSVGGAYEIEITCQEKPGVEVFADENLLPLVLTEVADQTLHIRNKESISPKGTLKVVVHAPDIDRIEVSGACKGSISKIANETLRITTSGAAQLVASGQTKALTIGLSGAGAIDAGGLKARTARVTSSGAGKVDVDVSETLSAEISGVGVVRYSGDPKSVEKSISGLGRLVKK